MGRYKMRNRRSKKIRAVALLVILLWTVVVPYLGMEPRVSAGTIPENCGLDADAIIASNNIPLSIVNNKGQKVTLNKKLLSELGLVAYGSPFGSVNGGHYRYLGYTIDGNVYTNPYYPPDKEVQYHVGKSWTKYPWDDPIARKKLVQQWGISDQGFNNAAESDKWLSERLVSPYPLRPYNWLEDFNTLPGNTWRNIKFPWDTKTLKEYGVIVSPPGKYVWGTFVMFNKGSGTNDGINTGGDWYQDFLIEPDVLFCGGKERDLFVSYVEGGEYEPNVPKTTRVKVGLSKGSDVSSISNVKVNLYVAGSLVGSQTVTLTRGEEKSLSFTWVTANNSNLFIKAEINPSPRTHEEYWSKPGDVYANNVRSTIISSNAAPPPIIGSCQINDPNSGYSRGISGRYYYSCPPCDEYGCSTCIGYYFEELWVDMLDPKPTTVQAGQGTEIQVKTTYENDNPAHAGRPYGPKNVILEAPNTDRWPSVQIENEPMVPEKSMGSWKNTWKPPYAKFDGEGNWTKSSTPPSIDPDKNEFGGLQRWYFGFDVPDGEEFTLYSHVTAGYQNGLSACDGRIIRVEGTPTDDYVIRVVDPSNPFPTGEVGLNWQGYDSEGHFYDYTDRILKLKDWYTEPERLYQQKVEGYKNGKIINDNLNYYQKNMSDNIKGLAGK